jgi:hypothetical protein
MLCLETVSISNLLQCLWCYIKMRLPMSSVGTWDGMASTCAKSPIRRGLSSHWSLLLSLHIRTNLLHAKSSFYLSSMVKNKKKVLLQKWSFHFSQNQGLGA